MLDHSVSVVKPELYSLRCASLVEIVCKLGFSLFAFLCLIQTVEGKV